MDASIGSSDNNDNNIKKNKILSWNGLSKKNEKEINELNDKMKKMLIGKKGIERDDIISEWNEKKMDLMRQHLKEKRELEDLEDKGLIVIPEKDDDDTNNISSVAENNNKSMNSSSISKNKAKKQKYKPKEKDDNDKTKEGQDIDKNEKQNENQKPSAKVIEIDAIKIKIKPLNLVMIDIPADGNCLYSSIADQMKRKYKTSSHNYKSIRMICADYLKSHKSEFEGFLASGTEGDGVSYEAHINIVRNSSEWGGQLELSAISHALKQAIHVYSANEPTIIMGEEYDSNDKSDPPLRISFHKSYYALGNHYNSIIPL